MTTKEAFQWDASFFCKDGFLFFSKNHYFVTIFIKML